jgi:hypothetical protein
MGVVQVEAVEEPAAAVVAVVEERCNGNIFSKS